MSAEYIVGLSLACFGLGVGVGLMLPFIVIKMSKCAFDAGFDGEEA